jgi:hypothetical protein
MVQHPEFFSVVDFSQAVFNDLQTAIRRWHGSNKKQQTHNIWMLCFPNCKPSSSFWLLTLSSSIVMSCYRC